MSNRLRHAFKSVVDTVNQNWPRERMTRQIARAFGISVLLHLFLFGGIEVGSRLGWWESGPLAWLAGQLEANRKTRLEALKRLRAERERQIPVLFVDVDPSQASPEPPKETPYYGAVSSRAANPDPRDTATPEIKGAQTRVLKTADTVRASAGAPLQPSPPQPAPLQPSPPPPKPTPQSKPPPKPRPPAPKPPAPQPVPTREIGDLAMVDPTPKLEPHVSPRLPHPRQPAPRPRPRTLAEALARRGLNPDSALVGRRMKQEGGVRRMSIQSSLDVQGSPLGDYDRQFVAAVQKCWFTLLEQQRYSLDRVGRVVLKFRLTKDGRVNNLQVIESDVGEVYTTLCQVALTRPSPYKPWPPDVVRMVGADYRDVRFTFYY